MAIPPPWPNAVLPVMVESAIVPLAPPLSSIAPAFSARLPEKRLSLIVYLPPLPLESEAM